MGGCRGIRAVCSLFKRASACLYGWDGLCGCQEEEEMARRKRERERSGQTREGEEVHRHDLKVRKEETHVALPCGPLRVVVQP